MKKILSVILVAAIGLGGMNVQATQEKPEDVANLVGKRAYITPAVRLGTGVVMTLGGIVSLFCRFHVLPKVEHSFRAAAFSKLADGEKEYVSHLQSYSKDASLSIAILSLSFGILSIKEGFDGLKQVKGKRAFFKELAVKFKDEAEKKEKEQKQA